LARRAISGKLGAVPEQFIACPDCDLLHRAPRVADGASGRCCRCQALLFHQKKNSIERTLALTIAGMVLFAVANLFPFLSFDMQGRVTETTLLTGVQELYRQGMPSVSALVLLTAVLSPGIQLGLLLYVLLPLHFERRPWGLPRAFRLLRHIQPWSMMEVFLIGILVALVKLGEMAEIVPGLAIYSFAVLILVLAGAMASLDPRAVWRHVPVAG
jgi:paraquat-inducible protein A